MSTLTPTAERRALRWARALAFVLGIVWIVGSPVYRQVFGRNAKHLHAWMMFRDVALETVDARFYQQLADGTRVELDRWALLASERPAAVKQRRLRGQDATWRVARQLCRELGAGADVRVVARRATRDGWVWDYDGTTNLCRVRSPAKSPVKSGRAKPASEPT